MAWSLEIDGMASLHGSVRRQRQSGSSRHGQRHQILIAPQPLSTFQPSPFNHPHPTAHLKKKKNDASINLITFHSLHILGFRELHPFGKSCPHCPNTAVWFRRAGGLSI